MAKRAYDQNLELANRIKQRTGKLLNLPDVDVLRLAQKTLHRWAELECGNGNSLASWAIERDDETGKPFVCIYPHNGPSRREKIADKEAGALRRVKEVCERNGLHFFHQGDPRGCALYVSDKPLTGQNYPDGVACC